ncbi:hypothetical protein [Lysinibacillus sp. K60]|uniref:hypothetical protein n=1 Tax=Lysinibacillus sp. K60 TaxID=2720027 RepID=UPI001C8CC6FD|nr:hypothetical protein [Lysinibacillus sp. K60]MBX8942589.1 hypothetical protein [Lysinibacillus sp. K60]
MQIIRLSRFIQSVNDQKASEASLKALLNTFTCSANPDVQNFLHEKAIDSENRRSVRTYLVVDNNEIVGYFSLRIETFDFHLDVSKSLRRIISGNKSAERFPTLLIAQLGRSDKYRHQVPGREILLRALNTCINFASEIGGVYSAVVEYDDVPVLHSFYKNEGFKFIQQNHHNNKMMAGIKI